MASERCPVCERLPGTERKQLGSRDYCLHFADTLQLPNTNWGSYSVIEDCQKNAVDWRQRALLAEAVVEAARLLTENWDAQEGYVQTTLGVSMSVDGIKQRLKNYDAHRSKR